ncbi:hypothetical protein T261_3708 [Streptomyces lydicus]|nr:hypothetical protein T261_3708 [Streptomyces lydicus]
MLAPTGLFTPTVGRGRTAGRSPEGRHRGRQTTPARRRRNGEKNRGAADDNVRRNPKSATPKRSAPVR